MVASRFDSSPTNHLLSILYPFTHLGIAITELGQLGWAILLWRQSRSVAMIVLPILLTTLSYDNLILSLGNWLGEGRLLESLSMYRFLFHYIVVPLFIVVGVELAHRAGAAWANTIVRTLSWLVAFGLVGIDIKTNYIGLELVPTYFSGLLRYAPAPDQISGPPIITIVVTLFMVGIGIGTWVRLKLPWLFLGASLSLLGNAIPSSIAGTLPGSTSELILALSLLFTEQQIQLKSTEIQTPVVPEKPFAWDDGFPIREAGYSIYQTGTHIDGNFIQVLVPDHPYRDEQGKLRLITYLHGFALCVPEFYKAHLEELAQKGYYVFFPDFQRSTYVDDIKRKELEEPIQKQEQKRPLSVWFEVLTKVVSKRSRFRLGEHFRNKLSRRTKVAVPGTKLLRPTSFKIFRVSLAVVVFILVMRVVSLINRRYGQTLITLVSTVGLSLSHSPEEWANQSIDVTEKAWKKLSDENLQLAESEFDFYVFGHSLGGLLALSWPIYLNKGQERFFPKQIITADPAPSTEMGIPRIAIWILKLFNSPFSEKPINIRTIGSQLTVPVGILHGADDKIVKPETWVKPPLGQQKSNYDCIASEKKKIYFSLSDPNRNPPLVAFHNQAVTDTKINSDEGDLFNYFGGAKDEPDLYNKQYIWPGVDLVVTNKANVNELLDNFNRPGGITVLDTLPKKLINWAGITIAIIGVLAVCGLGYWVWQSHAFA